MKKIIIFIVLSSVVSVLMGCAGPPMTREQYIVAKANYDKIRSKTYMGKSEEDVLVAVDKLFRAADKDYHIAYGENGCIAYRNWFVYIIIAAAWGKDYWYIDIQPEETGVTVKIREFTQAGAVFASSTGGGGAQATSVASMVNPDVIEEPELIYREAMYYVFFKRLDFLLGLNDEWIDCKSAYEHKSKLKLKGPLDPLCTVASDKLPERAQEIQNKNK